MTEIDKRVIRREAHAARALQRDKDVVSRLILARATRLAEYRAAKRILFYVDVRDEVRTQPVIREALRDRRAEVVVPWCAGRRLELFRLSVWEQLIPGQFGVLEPKPELRRHHRHGIEPRDLDLVLVPGVAFDRSGNRIGHGQGYYDRFLSEVPRSTLLVGLAYDCQVYPQLVAEPHDVCLDRVVTQSGVYMGRGRRSDRYRG